MAQAEGSHSVFTSRQSNRSQLPSMYLQPRNSARPRHMSRVYSISFHLRVTRYAVDDYHRTATWMYITLHNVRFRRTIERIELIFSECERSLRAVAPPSVVCLSVCRL